MKIDNRSLAYRLVVAILLAFVLVAGAVFLVGNRIITDIVDDYHHLVANNQASETKRLFEAAIAELTTARLLGSPEVSTARQQSLVEAINLNWSQRGVGGVIIGQDGATLLTTFSPELTRRLVALLDQEYVEVMDQGSELFGQVELIHPWEWRVVTLVTDHGYEITGRAVTLLIPLLVLGPMLILLSLLFILGRQVQRPVAKLVACMAREQAVAEIGVTEFDRIGEAFNLSLSHIRERSTALSAELEERKRTEEELRTAWKNWMTTFDATADLMALLDAEGVIRQCNRAFAAFCGRGVSELLGQPCFQVVHSTPDHIAACPFVRARQSLCRQEMELTVAGTTFAVMVDPIVDEGGQFAGAVHTMHDISERKRMEEALIAEKNKFEAIIAGMGDGVSIQDRNYTILYQNEVHKRLIGDHQGATCYQAYERQEAICPGCPVALAMADGQVHSAERCVEFPEGPRYFEINASPLRDGTGAIIGGIELVREVTERKRNEAQLIQAQKMEGIGHLAGGVAHDFNNVLSVVQGYADLLLIKRADDSVVTEYVAQIKQAVRRGTTITRQILAFSRKEAMTVQTADLNELVNALEKMLRRLVREDIDIQLQPSSAGPLLVSVDPGQIDQILINLTTNACHAMPNGGTFRIETRDTFIDEEFIKAHGYGVVGPYALLTVSDTGLGMTESVRQRIFEPFFTTKEVGTGTGLGLAMVYGIVQKHGGHINVYSEPGHGTVFRIYLPLVTRRAAEQNESRAAIAGGFQGGTETILVAEDDPALREWLQTWVSMGGYTVIEAGDGEEAVEKFKAQSDTIHLVLLDGIMPRKNGKEALLEMRTRCPELKAMILSGYAEGVFTQSELVDLQVTFVEKPVEPEHLMRRIRQLLDEG